MGHARQHLNAREHGGALSAQDWAIWTQRGAAKTFAAVQAVASLHVSEYEAFYNKGRTDKGVPVGSYVFAFDTVAEGQSSWASNWSGPFRVLDEPVNGAVQVLDEHDEQPNGEPAVYTYGIARLYPADMSRVGD